MGFDETVLTAIQNTTINDIERGSKAYTERERRGYIYRGALNTVQNNFADDNKVCSGISHLLKGWHNSFYRFGAFDGAEILKTIGHHRNAVNGLRTQNIRNVQLGEPFEDEVRPVFYAFLDATAGRNSRFTRRTVTGTSKSLSLLAPNLFPMCDEAISQAYDCWWVYSDCGFIDYMRFTGYMKILAGKLVDEYSQRHSIQDLNEAETLLVEEIREYAGDSHHYAKGLLKTIDEYNYAKHTGGWMC